MLRVLFISQYLRQNGTEVFMMNVFRNINREHFGIDFLIFNDEITPFSQEVEDAGSKIYRLPTRKVGLFRYRKALDTFYRRHAKDYNAIHFCGGNLSSIAPIEYASKYGIPNIIVHSHNSSCDGLFNNILHRINRKLVNRYVTNRLACSSSAAKWFWGTKETLIVANGINLNKFAFDHSSRVSTRQSLGVREDDILIGHIGRFEPVKNHTKLVSIFCSLHSVNKHSKLCLIGVGKEIDKIKEMVRHMGLSDHVLFMGSINDVSPFLRAMDVFVMPSLFEGMPFVLLEAQTSGLPCVVSSVVNREVKILPHFEFLDLNDPDSVWVRAVLDSIPKATKREIGKTYLLNAGFSINQTIDELVNIYTSHENCD